MSLPGYSQVQVELPPEEPGKGKSPWPATFSALEVPNFRKFFIGQGASLTGTWMRRVALGWLVFQITGRMDLLGLVMGLSLLPLFVLAPIAGSIADHVDKRRMLVMSQIAATMVASTLAILVFLDAIQIWQLMCLAVMSGIAFSFEVPARQSFIVELVGKKHLMNAIALNSGLVNLARIVGPMIAGFLMGSFGIWVVFAIDALSYVVVVLTLISLKIPPIERKPLVGSRFHHLIDGVIEARRNRPVRMILTLLFCTGVLGWSFQTLLPGIAQDYLHISEMKYGVLMAMFGLGAIIGALMTASRPPESNRRALAYSGVLFMCVGVFLLGTFPNYWLMLTFLVIIGFGAVTFISTGNTIVQLSVEDDFRGRVMGLWALGFGGSLPLGSFIAGISAEHIGPFLTIQIAATALTVIALSLWFLGRKNPSTVSEGAKEETAPPIEDAASDNDVLGEPVATGSR